MNIEKISLDMECGIYGDPFSSSCTFDPQKKDFHFHYCLGDTITEQIQAYCYLTKGNNDFILIGDINNNGRYSKEECAALKSIDGIQVEMKRYSLFTERKALNPYVRLTVDKNYSYQIYQSILLQVQKNQSVIESISDKIYIHPSYDHSQAGVWVYPDRVVTDTHSAIFFAELGMGDLDNRLLQIALTERIMDTVAARHPEQEFYAYAFSINRENNSVRMGCSYKNKPSSNLKSW